MSSDSQGQLVDGPNVGRRRQAFSLSLALRSHRRKRNSIMRPPAPSPTCAEKAHYPIFNPRDPRHNPIAANSCLVRSNHASETRGSVRWMQSLPRRSLRKARSGLFALTAGIQRRASSRKRDLAETWITSDPKALPNDGKQMPFSTSTASVASTAVDAEFGVGLYRIKCNCSTLRLNTHEYMLTISSSSSLTLLSPFTIPEGNPEAPKYSGSRLEETSGLQVRISPNSREIGWYDEYNDPTQGSEVSARHASDSTLGDSLKENIPQITDFKLNTEPLCLFDRPSSNSSLAMLLGSDEDGDGQLLEGSSLSTENTAETFSVSADLNKPNELFDGQSEMTGVHVNMTAGNLTATTRPYRENTTEQLPTMPGYFDDGHYQASERSLPRLEITDLSSDPSTHLNYRSDEGSSTERTSFSVNQWSPVDNEDWIPLSFRNEYFSVDGKTYDFRPDRGNNATKAEKSISGDGSIHNGPGLDREFSLRNRPTPEVIGPGTSYQRQVSQPRLERVGSDSTEEYIPTYPTLSPRGFHR